MQHRCAGFWEGLKFRQDLVRGAPTVDGDYAAANRAAGSKHMIEHFHLVAPKRQALSATVKPDLAYIACLG